MGDFSYWAFHNFWKFFFSLYKPKRKIIGKSSDDGPVLYVFNHMGLLGYPCVSATIKTRVYVWANSPLTEWKNCHKYISATLFQNDLNLSRMPSDIISLVLSLIIVPVFRLIDSIPIYRNNPKMRKKSYELTFRHLNEGHAILICPEDGNAKIEVGVKPFKKGVGYLIRGYYKRFGTHLKVIPVAVNNRADVILGAPIRFRSGQTPDLIALYLEKKIRSLYKTLDKCV